MLGKGQGGDVEEKRMTDQEENSSQEDFSV
jgi:hypothetical protein